MKKNLLLTFTLCIIIPTIFSGCIHSPAKEKTAQDYLDAYSFSTTLGTENFPLNDAQKFVLNMGFGWNLGNTFDAYSGNLSDLSTENCWGQPTTTKAMIDGLKAGGINTIRIPVSWHNHFIDDKYTIDPLWMARIQEVVDWAVGNDMYIILNIHHDDANYKSDPIGYNDGFYPLRKDQPESERFLKAVWTQVGETFKDYNEKLTFETMNEPRLRDDPHEWYAANGCKKCEEATQVLREYNQLCINTIRSTGGNNATIRYISCPNLCASPDIAMNTNFGDEDNFKTQIEVLEDSIPNHLIQSVHMYTPWNFAGEYTSTTENEKFTDDIQNTLHNYFGWIYTRFIKKGYPVIVGEMGAVNKNNLDDRAKYLTFFLAEAKLASTTACIWDNGNAAVGNDSFGFYNRRKQSWEFPLLHDIAVMQTENCTKIIKANYE